MEVDVFYYFLSMFDIWFLGETLLVDFLEMAIYFVDVIIQSLQAFVYETLDLSDYYITSLA